MTDEYIDILDKHGKPTGIVRLKSEAHRLGLYHASVHIWFFKSSGELLLQKRAYDKDTYPGLWDVSVAGHIGTEESVVNAAIREIKEEIGIAIEIANLEHIGLWLSQKTPVPYLFDNEFQHIFLVRSNIDLEDISLQEEEVCEIKFIDIKKLQMHLKDPIYSKEYVPHGVEYFSFILESVLNRLAQ